jgi:RNA polymerase sigma factor (sigma-70 family)
MTGSCSIQIEEETAQLYREYARRIERFTTGLAHDPELGADAVQEAFLRYLDVRRAGHGIEKPSAWLHKVAHNYVLDYLAHVRPIRETSDLLPEPAAGAGSCPETAVSDHQLGAQLSATLTARESACLHLRAAGHSYAEIATRLGIRSGTVGALLSRASSRLRHHAGLELGRRATLAGLHSLARIGVHSS